MKMYFKLYSQRFKPLLLTLCLLIVSLLICHILFYGKVSKVSGQLKTYEIADYNYIYMLNYATGISNECIFSDSDIQFYLDENGAQRLSVSSVMREDDVYYDLDYLSFLNDLNTKEVCLSKNVASKYNLIVGDILFAEFSYSSALFPTLVAKVIDTEYDFYNPLIDNDIGVVFIGMDATYKETTKASYALFAEEKMGDVLSDYPQVLSGEIINKSANEETIIQQGIPAIILSVLLSVISIYLSDYFFFSKSGKILYRLYLKGMDSKLQVLLPFIEKIVIVLVPDLLIQYSVYRGLADNTISNVYCACPLAVHTIYALLTLLFDIKRIKRK